MRLERVCCTSKECFKVHLLGLKPNLSIPSYVDTVYDYSMFYDYSLLLCVITIFFYIQSFVDNSQYGGTTICTKV